MSAAADPAALALQAAEWVTSTLETRPGTLAVALSGGSTPKRLYELLAAPPFLGRLPWDRVHWFWGDERFVPRGDPLSNYRMTQDTMLRTAGVPDDHVHPIPTEGLSPDQAAARYEAMLQAFYGARVLDPVRPLFEIVLLGLGPDGHMASLFPGTPALQEKTAWATAVSPPGQPTRITLTYKALESCRHAAFLVAGADKRDALAQVRAGADLPATHFHPEGQLHWFADQAAQA